MADRDDDAAWGTAEPTAPVRRAEVERALRALHMSDVDLRDTVMQLAARVVALTDELTRRLDGVEPQPAPPGTPAPPPEVTVEEAIERLLPDTVDQIRAADARGGYRVSIDLSGEDKYTSEASTPPCDELLPLCGGRCCTFSFALSTQDLDEGVIRWDYGQPYLIRQRASDGYCVHNDPSTRGCSVHVHRPRTCRRYDCRSDARVWTDYERRIPAPPIAHGTREAEAKGGSAFDLLDRARRRKVAVHVEAAAVSESFADAEPVRGPKPR